MHGYECYTSILLARTSRAVIGANLCNRYEQSFAGQPDQVYSAVMVPKGRFRLNYRGSGFTWWGDILALCTGEACHLLCCHDALGKDRILLESLATDEFRAANVLSPGVKWSYVLFIWQIIINHYYLLPF